MDVRLEDGSTFGPLEAVATPGHAPDHLAYVTGTAALTGDAVLGEGSVFIAPDPGALAAYLDALARLRERELDVLCPGHGPLVFDPDAKLDQYISHRLDRERRLLAALEHGKRSVDELLDEAWADVPAGLRPAAAVTLAAHLDKLADEGRLPAGVERPALELPLADGEASEAKPAQPLAGDRERGRQRRGRSSPRPRRRSGAASRRSGGRAGRRRSGCSRSAPRRC